MRSLACLKKLVSVGVCAVLSANAFAETYPTKPIKIVVPFPPGGSIDMVARIVGQELSQSLKQPVYIENKPGASGNIGMDHVAKAPKDGYTLLLAHAGYASNKYLFAKLSFDPFKDLAPITYIADQPNVLIVNPSRVKANNVQELIKIAKDNPGKLSFGTSGVGGPQDVAARMFMTQTKTDMLNVPYKGGAPALADLLGGQIDLMFETSPTAVPNAKSGKIKALAVTTEKRLENLPEVPTVAEAGVAGYKSVAWMGLVAPSGTPVEIQKILSEAMQRIIASEGMRKQLTDINLIPVGGDIKNFSRHLKLEADYYANLVRKNNITPQ